MVDDYVASAEPVGSASIARRYHLGISPATIRNELADLEEQGYLEQPHASAGRIPSDKGYRYYVDYIAQVPEPQPEELARLRQLLDPHRGSASDLAQAAARFLGDLTHYLVLMTVPEPAPAVCRAVHLLPLPPDRVLLVLVAEDGQVYGMGVAAEEADAGLLARVAAALSERVSGWSLAQAEEALAEALAGHPELGALGGRLAAALGARRERGYRGQVCIGGAPHLLRQPEFRDVERARGLLSALEEERILAELLSLAPAEGVAVAIGDEWASRPVEDCSLVSAGYRVGGRPGGRIGVLGPRRMDYPRVMGLLDLVSRSITDLLR